MKLFEIATEYQHLINDLYDEDGNENPEAVIKLEENQLALEKKAIAIASWIKNMELEAASLKGIKKQIDEAKQNVLDREKRLTNIIDRWEGYIKDNMEMRGIKEIKCPYFILKLLNKAPSVEIYNEDEITDDYLVITKRPDKIKMLEHMKEGILIDGARLKKGMRLQIK
jgi:hypothetical protein